MKKVLVLTLTAFTVASLASCANVKEDNYAAITSTETMVITMPTIKTEQTETSAPTIPETEPIIVEEDITFSYEYISEDDFIPYGLFTPSTADSNEETPLIVWLHGSGERDVGEKTFSNKGLPHVLNNWTLEGFNAYVICPQLTGKWNRGAWCFQEPKEYLQALIDKFVSEHNIDTDRIIITGHSLGAQGALYMAHELPEYFSKLVVFSGYWTDVDISEIVMPTIGYVGMVYYGEDGSSTSYMANNFEPVFGEENTYWLPTSHGNLPYVAFNEDKNENGHSDVIEWMFDY